MDKKVSGGGVMLRTITIDDREVLVRVSDVLLAELTEDWSEPVRLKAEQNPDGAYVFICQRVEPLETA